MKGGKVEGGRGTFAPYREMNEERIIMFCVSASLEEKEEKEGEYMGEQKKCEAPHRYVQTHQLQAKSLICTRRHINCT